MLVAPRRPGDRQRPAQHRVHHAQPARRPTDRRGPVRRRHGLAVPVRGRPGRAGRAAGLADRAARRTAARAGETASLRRDVVEGFRWTLHHPAVRTLALTILIFNVTFGAAWSVLVLYATERLGMGAIGFGLLTTVSAVGGLLGTGALRVDHPAGQPRQRDAGRPDHRDAHPSRAGGHHVAAGSRRRSSSSSARTRSSGAPRRSRSGSARFRPSCRAASAASTRSASSAAWSSARRSAASWPPGTA